tara:strand:+ start:54476 stop:55516 length:1041 start_codon:yes stop_codon:yes gene_type:complete
VNQSQKTGIQKEVSLTHLNTLGLHSVAPLFMNITSETQLIELNEKGFFSEKRPFVLGGGSNILLSSRLSVPVLKMSIPGMEMIDDDGKNVQIQVGAGENWHELVSFAVQNGLGGIENLALIPGTVGAAPIQNIGAYGVELEGLFLSLKAYDLKSSSFRTFSKSECQFGYRDSIFKRELKGQMVVTSVTLRLSKKDHIIHDSYSALRYYLTQNKIQNPGIEEIYQAVINIRQSKLPNPSDIGNAGSFFKNPVIKQKQYNELKDNWEGIPGYPNGPGWVKVPAAWLIEKAGWKGLRSGNVGTYKTQALVIVNHGGATGQEVLEFSKKIQKSVSEQFGIDLIPEVNIVH